MENLKIFGYAIFSGLFGAMALFTGKLTFSPLIDYQEKLNINGYLEISLRIFFFFCMLYANKLMLQFSLMNWKHNGATIGSALNFLANNGLTVILNSL